MLASSMGEMRSVGRTRLAGKGKERATDLKVSMKAREEVFHKGKQQETKGEDNGEEQELGRMAPNM